MILTTLYRPHMFRTRFARAVLCFAISGTIGTIVHGHELRARGAVEVGASPVHAHVRR